MLGDLVLVDDLPGADADGRLSVEATARDHLLDLTVFGVSTGDKPLATNSGDDNSNRFFSSKRPSWRFPPLISSRICPLRSAVIQSTPSMSMSVSIAFCEIMPRSPTTTTEPTPNSSLILRT